MPRRSRRPCSLCVRLCSPEASGARAEREDEEGAPSRAGRGKPVKPVWQSRLGWGPGRGCESAAPGWGNAGEEGWGGGRLEPPPNRKPPGDASTRPALCTPLPAKVRPWGSKGLCFCGQGSWTPKREASRATAPPQGRMDCCLLPHVSPQNAFQGPTSPVSPH